MYYICEGIYYILLYFIFVDDCIIYKDVFIGIILIGFYNSLMY